MRNKFFLIFIVVSVLFTVSTYAQKIKNNKETSFHKSPLFEDEELLHFKLTGRLDDLFNDRNPNSSYHPLSLEYVAADSSIISLRIQAKTRGHFRLLRQNCSMPPLLLAFSKEEKIKKNIFENEKKLKLVAPCRGDEYVIKEWLVYKLYNLLTDKSFKARLAQVEFIDSLKPRKSQIQYCILLEDEKNVAARNKAFIWKHKMVAMRNTDVDEFRKMAVFEYLIGNTDWSVPYLQNIILITKDSTRPAYPVPYDFDHAGIVDAPYAAPAEELEISSVRLRLYRGFCEGSIENFKKTIELFNNKKEDIYNLYKKCPLLKPKYIKYVTSYLDDFYKTINSDKKITDEFQKPCTSIIRVEIKGLGD